MSKGKALLETLLISAAIPIATWMVIFFYPYGLFLPVPMIITFFIIFGLTYSYVVFTRHKEQGKLFVFLTALLSCLLQFGILFGLLIFTGNDHDASAEGGHPNGDAILIILIVFMEPIILNLFSLFIRFVKAVIRLFKDD